MRWRTVLVLQVALALLASLYAIGRKSLWTDEGYSVAAAQRPFDSLVRLIVGDETNMGLYYVFLHGWEHLGDSPAMLRLPSALAMVATVPLLATLVDRTFDRRAAVAAGFLFAVSPMAVIYAQEARSYSLLALTATASMLLFLKLVDGAEERRRWWAAAWVAVTVVGVYLHFFALLVVVAQLVALAKRPDRLAVWRRLLAPTAVVGVLTVPVVLSAVFESADQIDWIPPISPRRVASLPAWFSGDLAPWGVGLLLSAGCLVAAAVWTVRRARAEAKAPEPPGAAARDLWRHALVWSWLVVPPVLTLLASLVDPVWLMRYLIVSLPASVALVAVGATRARRSWVPAAVTGALVASSALYLVAVYYPGPERWSADWRGASSYLARQSTADDPVLLQPPYGRNLLTYYASQDGHHPFYDVLIAPGDAFDGRMKAQQVSPQELRARLARSDRPVWLVRHSNAAGPLAACTTDLGLRPVETRSFGVVNVVRLERVPGAKSLTSDDCAKVIEPRIQSLS